MRITFRKYRADRWSLEGRVVSVDGKEAARIQMLRDGRYYWYGDRVNTSRNPTDLDTCKQQIRDHFTAKKKGKAK